MPSRRTHLLFVLLVDRIHRILDCHSLQVPCRDLEAQGEVQVNFLDGWGREELLEVFLVVDGARRRIDLPVQEEKSLGLAGGEGGPEVQDTAECLPPQLLCLLSDLQLNALLLCKASMSDVRSGPSRTGKAAVHGRLTQVIDVEDARRRGRALSPLGVLGHVLGRILGRRRGDALHGGVDLGEWFGHGEALCFEFPDSGRFWG